MRILIVEDDAPLASFVARGLEAEHYAVDVSHDGEQAFVMAEKHDYNLMVLDLNLPCLDGVSVLRNMHLAKPNLPIMVLTARSRVEDRVRCLDAGADDYLIKPFAFAELAARIRVLLRRGRLPSESVLTFADLTLDRVERHVHRAGRRIELTTREFALLECLMRNVGHRVTRAMILERVWNLASDTNTNVVDVYVNFSRQRPLMVEGYPEVEGSLTFGTGVVLQKVESLRDPMLQLRIQEETQQQGQLDSFVSAMSQVQVMFSSSSGDIGAQISSFFSSLNQLSTDPTNTSLRQGVLTAAGNLANAFGTTSQNLTLQQSNLDLSVKQTVDQINVLTSQIAQLNGQITEMQNLGQDASAFIDQRDVLIGNLSQLVDVSTIHSDDSLTLTTSNGTPMVAGNRSFDLSTQTDVSGMQHVFGQGVDITAKLTSGKLAGVLQVRDQKIPALQTNLDTLAAGFANAVNTVHRGGFDLNGHQGGDIFVAPPASGVGAAASMAVAITDPALVAASSDGSPASNGNLAAISAVHDQAVSAGRTPTDFYANLVFGVGSDVSNGTAEQEAVGLVLRQLQDQRGSVSGVSLDEEAANMMQYQDAYDAAARVVTTVNDMLDVVINLGRY